MGKEIERKFLVKDGTYKTLADGILYYQGFLSLSKERVVRVRIVGKKAFLTIKGVSKGPVRDEFEYEIPLKDAEYIINKICIKPAIIKKRYRISWKGFIWEVDEFLNENKGLVIAEIELEDENQVFDFPEWVGKEVTGEEKYYNACLVKHPYTTWS